MYKTNIHTLCCESMFLLKKSTGSESVSELVSDGVVTFVYGTARVDTDDSIIWCSRVACWITTVIQTHRHALRMFDAYTHYRRNQQDATLAVLFISNCKITLHVSDASRVHHQEY